MKTLYLAIFSSLLIITFCQDIQDLSLPDQLFNNELPKPLQCVENSCQRHIQPCQESPACKDVYECLFPCGSDADCYADCLPIKVDPSDPITNKFSLCAIPCLGIAKRIATRTHFHQCLLNRCDSLIRKCFYSSSICRNALVCGEQCADRDPMCISGCFGNNGDDNFANNLWICAQQCLH